MKGLETDLRRIFDDKAVLASPEMLQAYANDACHYFRRVMPEAAVLPQTTEQIAALMKYASANRIPVTPRGAGTGLSGGATPVKGGIVLDMKRMNRLNEIDRPNMTANVQAGMVLNDFQRQVEKGRLFYPPDPQSYRVCTIGGNIATRAGGPKGVKYGVTSNYVLGLEAVLPDGSIIKTGGKFVKQSAGYNLTQILAGSEGTLAVIAAATLRLLSLPTYHQTVVVVCATLDQSADMVAEITASGTPPAMLELLMGLAIVNMNPFLKTPLPVDGGGYLLMDIDGSPEDVARDTRLISDICYSLGAREVRIVENPEDAASYWQARANIVNLINLVFKRCIMEDVTVPRSMIPEFIRSIQSISASAGMLIGVAGHAGDGNIHPTMLGAEATPDWYERAGQVIEAVIQRGLELGGTISGEHGIGIHKQAYLPWDLGNEQIQLMKRIKTAFDPLNIMNPGKLWPEETVMPC